MSGGSHPRLCRGIYGVVPVGVAWRHVLAPCRGLTPLGTPAPAFAGRVAALWAGGMASGPK